MDAIVKEQPYAKIKDIQGKISLFNSHVAHQLKD